MRKLLVLVLMIAPAAVFAKDRQADNAFLNLLWLVHSTGTVEATSPAHDVDTKAALVAALKKGRSLTPQTAVGLLTKDTFARLAGDDGELDPAEVRRFLEKQVPESRQSMFPKLVEHASFLTTGFDQIGDSHHEPIQDLVEWIVETYKAGEQLPINFVCIGNSRRSMLGAVLGNAAAAYYGLPEIRCYSGGSDPSAFNERTIVTLREIGFEIEPTGKQAKLGSEATNPIYKIRWGRGVAGSAQESLEFSKRYDDPHYPRKGFAAVMICSEADGSCPNVPGAAVSIAMPYLDPKLYDDTEFETRKYAERRDDIGRALLAVMMQARLRLALQGKLQIEK